MPCLIRKERSWVLRQKLEALSASFTYFVTLTYSDQNRPYRLQYDHVQTFLKSLRHAHRKATVRFFCSGEYGEKSNREHWHLNIFSTERLLLPAGRSVIKQWPHGAVFVGNLTTASMGYVAKYVIEGNPQIIQASRRPGIGVPAIRALAQRMVKQNDELEDIPTTMHVGGKLFPLSRTMRAHFADAWLRSGGTITVNHRALRIYTDTWDRLALAIAMRGTPDQFAAIDIKTERLLLEEKNAKTF